MKKQPKPNLQIILKSAIAALQVTYNNYKTAVIKDLEYTWYSDNGEFTFLAGVEERRKKIADLGEEVVRLHAKVDEIKNEMEADKAEIEPQEGAIRDDATNKKRTKSLS